MSESERLKLLFSPEGNKWLLKRLLKELHCKAKGIWPQTCKLNEITNKHWMMKKKHKKYLLFKLALLLKCPYYISWMWIIKGLRLFAQRKAISYCILFTCIPKASHIYKADSRIWEIQFPDIMLCRNMLLYCIYFLEFTNINVKKLFVFIVTENTVQYNTCFPALFLM